MLSRGNRVMNFYTGEDAFEDLNIFVSGLYTAHG